MTSSPEQSAPWLLPGAVGLLLVNLLFLGVAGVWLLGFRAELVWAAEQHQELSARTREAWERRDSRGADVEPTATDGTCRTLRSTLLELNANLEEQGLPPVPDDELAGMLRDAGCSTDLPAGAEPREDRP